MKKIYICVSIILITYITNNTKAATTIDIEFGKWYGDALTAGLTDGGSQGIDIDSDGDIDITVGYSTFSNSGNAAVTASVSDDERVSFSNRLSSAAFGDMALANLQFTFEAGFFNNNPAHFIVTAPTDIDTSSQNGKTKAYEFGAVELILNGGAPQLDAATIMSYNASSYGNNGTGLIHDLFNGGAPIDGVAWYDQPTVTEADFINNPGNVGVDGIAGTTDDDDAISGTGVSNTQQHYDANGSGTDLWNHFSPGSQPVGNDSWGNASQTFTVSFWSGAVNVRNNGNTFSSTPGSSLGGGNITFTPEPSTTLLVMIGGILLSVRRYRNRKY